METKTIVDRGTEFTVKRNLFRCPILKTGYIKKDRKITCIIDWYDPIYDVVRTTRASAVRNPNDVSNDIFGKKLAESRCKMNIYDKYYKEIRKIRWETNRKYSNLIGEEEIHQQRIINNL